MTGPSDGAGEIDAVALEDTQATLRPLAVMPDIAEDSDDHAPTRRTQPVTTHRPTAAELAAATERTIPDVIGPGLDVLFVGINPGLYSGATGFHFARPGNRFWKAIHLAGFTERVLDPSEQDELLRAGIGITNLVARTTATAAELSPDELKAGTLILIDEVERWRPHTVAFLGISTYRVGFQAPKATIGRQPIRLAGADVWVLPNPSGLNASWQLPRLVDAYRELRESVTSA